VGQTSLSQNVAFDDIGKGTVEFIADGAGDVVITFMAREQAHKWRVYLSGFELSGVSLVPRIEFESTSSGDLETVSPAVIGVALKWPEEGQTYTVDYGVVGGTAAAGADYVIGTGGPMCWNYPTQCHGDTDNTGDVKGSDFLIFKNSWYQCDPDANYNPCADFDHDGCVKGSDFLILKDNWYLTAEANCPSSGGGTTLTFNPGETSKTIEIDIVDDGLDEEDETIMIGLSNPTGLDVQLGSITEHTYTIIDPRPYVQFDNESSYGNENVTPASVAVSLSHPWATTVTVDYAVTGGTAATGIDYNLSAGTLTFDTYQTTAYITIDILDDVEQEGPETIELTLSTPGNAKLGNIIQHTFAIIDDEMGETFTNSLGMELVRIDPGTFTMGSTDGDFDEKPVHTVAISRPFYMGKYEVTNADYEQFDPSHGSINHRGFSHLPNEAVIFVSWEDANAFCDWLSQREGLPYRLPTEAEWEYACRAGTTTPYNTGYNCDADKNQSNTTGPDPVSLAVGATGPNPWGLYDMHGNVEEWCYDWYGPYEAGHQTDPVGRADGEVKVSRGGSHSTPVYYLRSANRLGTVPDDKQWLIGCRVVMGELPGAEPLPPPLQRYQTNVSQEIPPDINEGPDPDVPYFGGPRRYVFIPPELNNGPLYTEHNHVPGIVECPNGDLLAIWYSTIGERDRLLTIAASRLRYGDDTWEQASWFWDTPDRNSHTPSIWLDEETGAIFHFNGISDAYSWTPLALMLRKSIDNGVSWSRPRLIIPEHDIRHMPVESIIRTSSGALILPCDAVPGGSGGTAIWISNDNGLTWYDPGSKMAGIHAPVAEISGNRLLGFGRSDNIDGMMPKSISSNMGQSWSYGASVFPPIGSGKRSVLLRLKEGPLFFASFGGDGLFAALSYDEGETWPVQRLITDGAPCHQVETTDGERFSMCPDSAEPRGYLSICQGRNGVIHLISSRQHYEFNLRWVVGN
jgi:formylglycine-generating enzyme required for sulfatase activity